MKPEYDFTHGERGKFFIPETEIQLPFYLEPGEEMEVRDMQRTTFFPGDAGFKYLDDEEKALIDDIEASAASLQPMQKAEKDAFLAQFHKPGSVHV